MDIQLKRGLLDVCVLAAIKDEDSYGYKIIKDMKPYMELSESTLYTILKRLETAHMLTVHTVEHGGRLRKYYHITEEGLGRIEELKEELDRIFETTTFNERRIWEVTGNKKQIGTVKKQAVTSSTGYTSFDVTNDNYGVLAVNSYKVNANDAGIWISWKGYDNQDYQTEVVDWDTLEANNYSFEMSDYFDKQTYGKLFISAGNPVLKKKISFSVIESATRADIIKSLNGVYMGGSESASFAARFENADGTVKSSDVSVTALTMYYEASSVSLTYASGDDADDGINHWWEWKEYKSNGVTVRYKDDIDRQLGGTLGDVMDALTGAKGTNNSGLLTEQKGGGTNTGGTITSDLR